MICLAPGAGHCAIHDAAIEIAPECEEARRHAREGSKRGTRIRKTAFSMARRSPPRAPGARDSAKEGAVSARKRSLAPTGRVVGSPAPPAATTKAARWERNRQAAGASIPWSPAGPGACDQVPRVSSGPATGAPLAGSARRAKVPVPRTACAPDARPLTGTWAGRSRAASNSANCDRAVRWWARPGESGKRRAAVKGRSKTG